MKAFKSICFILLSLIAVGIYTIACYSTQQGAIIVSGSSTINPPVWDDLVVPLLRSRITGAAGDPGLGAFIGATKAFAFDAASDESVYFDFQLSHKYKMGTSIHPHIHWAVPSTDEATVSWCIECVWADINATYAGSTTKLCVDAATIQVANRHTYTDIGDFAVASAAVSMVGLCRFWRDANAGEAAMTDTYDDDAFALSLDFHYQIDTLGSRQEIVK